MWCDVEPGNVRVDQEIYHTKAELFFKFEGKPRKKRNKIIFKYSQ